MKSTSFKNEKGRTIHIELLEVLHKIWLPSNLCVESFTPICLREPDEFR